MKLKMILIAALSMAVTIVFAQNVMRNLSQCERVAYSDFKSVHPFEYIKKDNNWQLLYMLRTPSTAKALRKAGLTFNDEQLTYLEKAGMVKQVESNKWQTTLPNFDIEQTAALRQLSRSIATDVMDKSEGDYRQLVTELGKSNFADNAFSIAFSYMLDGLAWDAIAPDRYKLDNKADWKGVVWILCEPRKKTQFGTNSYGSIQETWTRTSLKNAPQHADLMPLAQCLLDNEELKEATVIDHLKPYGIVNEAGKLKIPVIDREKQDAVNNLCHRLSASLASAVKDNITRAQAITKIDDKRTSIVLFHEIMWDTIDLLQARNLVKVPEVLTNEAAPKEQFHNVMFVIE